MAHADKGSASLQYFYTSTCIIQINFEFEQRANRDIT